MKAVVQVGIQNIAKQLLKLYFYLNFIVTYPYTAFYGSKQISEVVFWMYSYHLRRVLLYRFDYLKCCSFQCRFDFGEHKQNQSVVMSVFWLVVLTRGSDTWPQTSWQTARTVSRVICLNEESMSCFSTIHPLPSYL